jgi:hypothetical protein
MEEGYPLCGRSRSNWNCSPAFLRAVCVNLRRLNASLEAATYHLKARVGPESMWVLHAYIPGSSYE